MSKVIVTKSKLDTLADTINAKAGTTGSKTIDELNTTVDSIETGGSTSDWWWNYCGTRTTFKGFLANSSLELTETPAINTVNGTIFSNMYSSCRGLKTVGTIDTTKGTGFDGMYGYCSALIELPIMDLSNGINFNSMFVYCSALETIRGVLNLQNATANASMFHNCGKLKNITFVANSIKISISFASSPLLTNDSINSIINGLADLPGLTAQTLTLHSSIVLTSEQTATISSKNWTLVQ